MKAPIQQADKIKSYYKYYEMDIAPAPSGVMAMIARGIGNVEDGLPIPERNKLLSDCAPANPGFFPLKDGGLLVSSDVPMPGVTPGMLYWWFGWHGLDPFRYTIWDPEDHFGLELNDEGRRRAGDVSVPWDEKTWGATHTVLESIGGPPDEIVIMFQNPADLDFDTDLVGTDNCQFLVAANALMGKMKVPVVMAESASKSPEGLMYHCRFWLGYHIAGGEGKYLLPPDAVLPHEAAAGLIAHNYKEFSHLAKILPSLYAEEKD
jgi:hypothetical protein